MRGFGIIHKLIPSYLLCAWHLGDTVVNKTENILTLVGFKPSRETVVK